MNYLKQSIFLGALVIAPIATGCEDDETPSVVVDAGEPSSPDAGPDGSKPSGLAQPGLTSPPAAGKVPSDMKPPGME